MLLLQGNNCLEMITGNSYDSAKALSSNAAGYGCHQCIRNGWVYAVPDSQTWYATIPSGEAYAGECCDTLANCPNAYDSGTSDNVKAGWKASTVTFGSVDLAVHACPQKADLCYTQNTNADKKTHGFHDGVQYTPQDSCSFLRWTNIPTNKEYGTPIFNTYYGTTLTNSDIKLHYVEWNDA